ncbi:MAG: hypothetical protein RL217_1027 [Pseudomonadota bacterium]|jgi:flagellar assembly protein FliH
MAKISQQPTLSADQVQSVKPWRLPFWTQEPAWVSEKVEKDLRRKSRVKVFKGDESPAPEGIDVAVASPVETVEIKLPTAEELENIRREAYNAGLEQGLIEGRQQGHKESFAQGHSEGLEAGLKEGKEQGIELGKSEGLALGQVQIDSAVTRLNQLAQLLQSRIQERDAALPEVLVQLVESLCRQVVGSELKMGAAGIGLVLEQSLAQLPEGSSNVRVFVSPVDYALLKSSHLAEGELALKEDSNLQAGDLRIQTEHSLVEYQSQERLSELVQQAQMQMRHALTLQQALNTMPTPDQSPEVQDDAPPQ